LKLTKKKFLLIVIAWLGIITACVIYYNKTSLFGVPVSVNPIDEEIDLSLDDNEALNKQNDRIARTVKQSSPLTTWLLSLKDSMMPQSSQLNSITDTEQPKNLSTPKVIPYNSNKQALPVLFYLKNINLLIINFLQDKDYFEQFSQIEALSDNSRLPAKIKKILHDFNKYNTNYLSENNVNRIKIFPKDHGNYLVLEKFIKIEKKSVSAKESEKLRTCIIENLETFINYFYTQEFVELLQGLEQ